ncbi:MAG: hemerythrin domain-containing protein [Sulfobacillus sp.]
MGVGPSRDVMIRLKQDHQKVTDILSLLSDALAETDDIAWRNSTMEHVRGFLGANLPLHMTTEETEVFPLLSESHVSIPLKQLEDDHQAFRQWLIWWQTVAVQDDAIEVISSMSILLQQHIAKENEHIFPLAIGAGEI